MQEEIEKKTINLAITTTRMSVRMLINGLKTYISYRNHKKMHDPFKHGKQTVRQLIKQGQGATSMEISNESLKTFESIAKRYGVDYAVTKDKSVEPPKYTVFFKARDADALQLIVDEYGDRLLNGRAKTSVLEKLEKLKEYVAAHYKPARNREKEMVR
ncbi:MAG TPA: PcfB family protein [Lachnospiraceae bacterium]|nr:PcfB family protein [Lachnospiraceae bacterium]